RGPPRSPRGPRPPRAESGLRRSSHPRDPPGNWGFACCVVFPRVRKRASRRSRTSQCRVESCKGTPKNLLAVLAPLAILASFWEPTKALLGEILRARRGVGGRARRRHVFGRAACAFACGEARAQC